MPRRLLFALAVLSIAAFAGLMFTKMLPYYTFEKGIHFLTTKNDDTNDNPMFRAGFYVHITISLLVLVAGLPQFLPGRGCTGGWANSSHAAIILPKRLRLL